MSTCGAKESKRTARLAIGRKLRTFALLHSCRLDLLASRQAALHDSSCEMGESECLAGMRADADEG